MSTFYRRDDWVTDAMGNAQSGASVYVCSQPATTGTIPPSPLVQLYSDPAGANPITQPVVTDGFGHAAYYVAAGTYTVLYYSPQIQEVVLPDQLIGGAGVTFPVTVPEGGTGATTAPQALINLGAAARGANADITSLSVITGAIAIAAGGSISINGGATVIDDTQITANTNIQGLQLKAVSGFVGDAIQNATPGNPIQINNVGGVGGDSVALLLNGDGAGTSLKSLLGFANYPIQSTVGSAGSASALPSNPSFYLQVHLAATNPLSLPAGVYVCPFYKQS